MCASDDDAMGSCFAALSIGELTEGRRPLCLQIDVGFSAHVHAWWWHGGDGQNSSIAMPVGCLANWTADDGQRVHHVRGIKRLTDGLLQWPKDTATPRSAAATYRQFNPPTFGTMSSSPPKTLKKTG